MLKRFLLIFVSFFTFACSVQEMQEKLLPDEVKIELQNLNKALIERNGSYLILQIHDSIVTENLASDIEKTLGYLPEGNPQKIELATVSYQTLNMVSGYSSKTYAVSYHFEYSEKFALVSYTLVDEGTGLKIRGLYINQSDVSFKETNALTLSGKGIFHYLVFGAAILVVGVIFWSLILCIKEKNIKRKPLWIIFILIGVGGFAINWTTGAWGFQFLFISLLGAGFTAAGPFSPWIIKVSFPLGALMFLILKKRGRLKYKTEKPSPDLTP